MKLQISHKQTGTAQILFATTGFTLPFLTFGFFLNNHHNVLLWILLTLSILLGSGFVYYSRRLSDVKFDNRFVYFSVLRQAKKIDMNNILEINPGVFPLRFYYTNVYFISITYLEDNANKKVYFLSKGTPGINGTVKDIPFLDMLKKLTREKKHKGL
jgi:hypothetical protein